MSPVDSEDCEKRGARCVIGRCRECCRDVSTVRNALCRAVEEGHVDGALVDNVAESGEESEDEWNYFKGEGEREHNPGEEPDEPPRSPTPCQDNVSTTNSLLASLTQCVDCSRNTPYCGNIFYS